MVHVEPVEIVDDGVIFVELECDGKGNLSPIRGTENLYQADSNDYCDKSRSEGQNCFNNDEAWKLMKKVCL